MKGRKVKSGSTGWNPRIFGRSSLRLLAILAATTPLGAVAQSQPIPQTLPYDQDFGSNGFTTPPPGIAAWGGLSGSSISDAAKAAVSIPTADAVIGSAGGPKTTGGPFGLSDEGNARFYIQTSSNSTLGACQMALALDTTGKTSISLNYDIEIVSAQPRSIGLLCQYRIGSSGSWSNLDTDSGANPFSQSGGATGVRDSVHIDLPVAASNQALVQIRWATWRGNEAGGSSGIAIDNIHISAETLSNTLAITLDPSVVPELDGMATATVTTAHPVASDLSVTLTIDDPTEAAVVSANPTVIPAGSSTAEFSILSVDDSHNDGSKPVSIQASAPATLPATAILTVTDNDDPWSPPENYYLAAEGLDGLALKSALKSIVTNGHLQLEYSEVLNPLRDIHTDPSLSSNLLTIYSAISLDKYASYYSGVAAGPGATWSREHLWPVSYGLDPEGVNPGYEGGDAGPDYTDLFNLRPEIHSVNMQRGNLYFDESFDNVTTPPLAPACSRDSDSWEPHDEVKGDIARALFYMATRYDGSDPLTVDLEISGTPSAAGYSFANLATLLLWHEQDPVSQTEREQNQLIYADYQGNRNPFVDHPEFVSRIWQTVRVENASMDLTEGMTGDDYTLVLTGQPTTDVIITVTSTPSGQLAATPDTITFTRENWNQPRLIHVTAIDDAVYEAPLTAALTHSITTTDSGYATLVPPPVIVSVTDNDPEIPPLPLPLEFDGPWSPLPSQGFLGEGMSSYASDLGEDTDTGSAKFDATGDHLTVAFDAAPLRLSYHLKGNPGSGSATYGTFKILESADGETFNLLRTIIDKDSGTDILSDPLAADSRFVSFHLENKSSGNLQLDKLSITAMPPWTAWRLIHGLNEITGAPGADPDSDGLTNLVEYAFGCDPVITTPYSETSSLEQTSIKFRIIATLRVSDPNLVTIAETTVDPSVTSSWTSLGIIRSIATDQSGVPTGFERSIFEVSTSADPRRFMRFRFVYE